METEKTTFRELLVALGVMKGNYHEYRCEYTLNSDDLDAIYMKAERTLKKRTGSTGRFDIVPGPPHSGIHWYWDANQKNVLGERLVRGEVILIFQRTSSGKIKVIHTEIDNVNFNARYNTEKGFLKTGLIKEFGLAE